MREIADFEITKLETMICKTTNLYTANSGKTSRRMVRCKAENILV
jgi:hypothetical protein